MWKWRIRRDPSKHAPLRDIAVVGTLLALLAALVLWAAYQFVRPAPPDVLVMTTGAEGGAYQAFAQRYRSILARDGIELVLRPSSGSLENLARLKDEASGVDVGFVQSGVGSAPDAPNLVSLGSLYHEPLWLFHSGGAPIERLVQLKDKRVAIGAEGSGTRKLALQLLAANEIRLAQAALLNIGLADVVHAFREGRIDAAFVIAAPESPALQALFRLEGVHLASISHAAAYTRRFPFLSSITLPQGAIDFVRDLPQHDTVLLAPSANLVTRDSLHPALMSLLIQAATEVHGTAGLLQRAGEFPAPVANDFPLSDEARRYYKSGTPFLQRYLPFWVAILVERLVVLVVPVILILLPLLRVLPFLYSWWVRSRIFRWYNDLKRVEDELEEKRGEESRADALARLDEIERRASHISVPLAFNNDLYTLREHIRFVRDRIGRPRNPGD